MLKQVAHKISLVPDNFHINPKMVGQLARRAKMGQGEVPMERLRHAVAAFPTLSEVWLKLVEGYLAVAAGDQPDQPDGASARPAGD